MRAGATVQTGGSRCHTTYFYRDGAFGYEDFDEGQTTVFSTPESTLRALIAEQPQLFADVLARPHFRRFSAAFLAGERNAARDALSSAFQYGDPLGHGKLLLAILAWPETYPSDEVLDLLRKDLRGLTAYHLFMGAAGWDHSVETALKGVAFANQLLEMVGECVGVYYLRATFQKQAGDFAAAGRDMEKEIERLPAEDWHRSHFQEQLDRLRKRLTIHAPSEIRDRATAHEVEHESSGLERD